jgi:hypothetical protein
VSGEKFKDAFKKSFRVEKYVALEVVDAFTARIWIFCLSNRL